MLLVCMCMGGGRESTNDFPHSLPLCSSLYQLPSTHHTHLDLLLLNLQLWPLSREQLSPMPAPYIWKWHCQHTALGKLRRTYFAPSLVGFNCLEVVYYTSPHIPSQKMKAKTEIIWKVSVYPTNLLSTTIKNLDLEKGSVIVWLCEPMASIP